MKYKILILILAFITLQGNAQHDLEIKVLNDIIQEIPSHITIRKKRYSDRDKLPWLILDENGKTIRIDTIALRNERRNFSQVHNTDSVGTKILVFDTLYSLNNEYTIRGIESAKKRTWLSDYHEILDTIKSVNKENIEFSINSIKKGAPLILVPQNYLTIESSQDSSQDSSQISSSGINGRNYISGRIVFSRIYFNETKDKGFLHVVYLCNSLCGESTLLFVKHTEDQWEIEYDYCIGIF